MKLDWEKAKITVERALRAAREDERGSMRVHCKAADTLLKGVKVAPAPDVYAHVHRASTAIETSLAIEELEKALNLLVVNDPA